MRIPRISYLWLAVLLLAFAVSGCLVPGATTTVPTTIQPTISPSTKTSAATTTQATTVPTTQTIISTTISPQYSVLKLDAPGPALLPANGLASPVVGQSFAQQLAATGGMAPYAWTIAAGNLPPGLTLSPGGLISGTPSSAGAFSITLVLTDAQGSSTLGGTYTFSVNNPPTTDSSGGDRPASVVRTAFYTCFPDFRYYKVNPSANWADLQRDQYLVIQPFIYGGQLPWKFTAVGLPKGLTCDSTTGLIQGTLTEAPDNLTVSIILTDANGAQANGSPAGFTLRLGYRAPTASTATPSGTRGTLSVSCGNGIAAVSGYGDIGRGGGVVSLNAGTYALTIRSPSTGKVVYQANIRIDSGKTTVVKWDGYVE